MNTIKTCKLFEDFFDEIAPDEIADSADELIVPQSESIDDYKFRIDFVIRQMKQYDKENLLDNINLFNERLKRIIIQQNRMIVYPVIQYKYYIAHEEEMDPALDTEEPFILNDKQSELYTKKSFGYLSSSACTLNIRIVFNPINIRNIDKCYRWLKSFYNVVNNIKSSVFMRTPVLSGIDICLISGITNKYLSSNKRFSYSRQGMIDIKNKVNITDGDAKKFRQMTLLLSEEYNYKISIKDAISYFKNEEWSKEEQKDLTFLNLMDSKYQKQRNGNVIEVTIPEDARWNVPYINIHSANRFNNIKVFINGEILISLFYDDSLKYLMPMLDKDINKMTLKVAVGYVNHHEDEIISDMKDFNIDKMVIKYDTDQKPNAYVKYNEQASEKKLPVFLCNCKTKKIINKSPLINSEN